MAESLAPVNKNAVGGFVLTGLFKVRTVRKPATTVVKVRPLKKLKDMLL